MDKCIPGDLSGFRGFAGVTGDGGGGGGVSTYYRGLYFSRNNIASQIYHLKVINVIKLPIGTYLFPFRCILTCTLSKLNCI